MSVRSCKTCKKEFWTRADCNSPVPKELRLKGIKTSTAILSRWFCSKKCEKKEARDTFWDGLEGAKDYRSFLEIMRPAWKRYNKEDFERILKEMLDT